MRAATVAARAEVPPVRPLRRAILRDPAGKRLAEVPMDAALPGGGSSFREGAARVLVAAGPNWSDRASTGDAMQIVIGRRACFGYIVNAAQVRWFSHPRLAGAGAFSVQDDRETRSWLYDLHAADPETVSEIVWESSGLISVRRGPVLPVGIDPGSGGSPERERAAAAYLRTMAWTLLGLAPRTSADAPLAQGLRS